MTFSNRTVNETRGQVAWGHLQALPDDAVGPAVNIAGVGVVRNALDRVRPAASIVWCRSWTRCRTSAARTRCGPAWMCWSTTTPSRSRARSRGAYTFSSLANFLAGTYNTSGFTQTFGATSVAQSSPAARRLRAGRMEGRSGGDVEPRTALRPAVARHRPARRRQPGAADWRRLDADRVAPQRACAAAPASTSIGCRCARSANALLSAGQHHRPGAAAADQRQPVAGAGAARRSFRPCSPPRCRRPRW